MPLHTIRGLFYVICSRRCDDDCNTMGYGENCRPWYWGLTIYTEAGSYRLALLTTSPVHPGIPVHLIHSEQTHLFRSASVNSGAFSRNVTPTNRVWNIHFAREWIAHHAFTSVALHIWVESEPQACSSQCEGDSGIFWWPKVPETMPTDLLQEPIDTLSV